MSIRHQIATIIGHDHDGTPFVRLTDPHARLHYGDRLYDTPHATQPCATVIGHWSDHTPMIAWRNTMAPGAYDAPLYGRTRPLRSLPIDIHPSDPISSSRP